MTINVLTQASAKFLKRLLRLFKRPFKFFKELYRFFDVRRNNIRDRNDKKATHNLYKIPEENIIEIINVYEKILDN